MMKKAGSSLDYQDKKMEIDLELLIPLVIIVLIFVTGALFFRRKMASSLDHENFQLPGEDQKSPPDKK